MPTDAIGDLLPSAVAGPVLFELVAGERAERPLSRSKLHACDAR